MVLIEGAQKYPTLFLDDWPARPKESCEKIGSGLDDIKRWQFQTILASHPFGIPLLAFIEEYERLFVQKLDIQGLGFVDFPQLVSNLSNIFTIQEPDETTAALFPEHPYEVVLHDARLGHQFEPIPMRELADRFDNNLLDYDILITLAGFNRDEPFPADVVLAGQHYQESILPLTDASLSGTRGIHRVVIVSAASPDYLFIHVQSDYLDRLAKMPAELDEHFESCPQLKEAFQVPDEFIYAGFPCLAFFKNRKSWERCAVICRAARGGKVLVESVDFGEIRAVSRGSLRLMPQKYLDIPKQAVCVSMMGLKPLHNGKWSSGAGKRLRCFSNIDYYLTSLLVEARRPNQQISNETSLATSESLSSLDSLKVKGKLKRRDIQFEALLCDRNDDEMDLHLGEILALETYAKFDQERSAEIEDLMDRFKQILASLPRNQP